MFKLTPVLAIFVTCSVWADIGYEKIQRAKDATVLVINSSDNSVLGSAFCFDARGYYVTNHHVIEEVRNGKVSLVLQAGTEKQVIISANVVRSDLEMDLAILEGERPTQQYLSLGDDSRLYETMEIVALGYPFGRALAKNEESYPNVSVNLGRVSALRRKANALERVQFDAQVNPGNSGGPILDGKGEVIGVVTSGVPGSGVNFAVPVEKVRKLLKKPVFLVDFPETVPWGERHRSRELPVTVDMFGDASRPDRLTLVLENGAENRKINGNPTKKGFVFKTTLLPKQRNAKVNIELAVSNATLTCFAEDHTILTKKGKMKLSEVASYEKSEGIEVSMGETVQPTTRNQKIKIHIANSQVSVPLSAIEWFQVIPTEVVSSVNYTIEAYEKDVKVAEVNGMIAFDEASSNSVAVSSRRRNTKGSFLEIKPPKSLTNKVERKLPAPISDVVLAGNGRIMLLVMESASQLAVFDIKELKVVKFIPLLGANTLIAGGASKLVMALPDQQIIQIWDLSTLKKGLTKVVSTGGVLMDMGMGYASEGPLMMRLAKGSGSLDSTPLTFFDLKNLKPIEGLTDIKLRRGDYYRDEAEYRFSADGRTIGIWEENVSPSGLLIAKISGSKLSSKSEHISVGHILPSPDGALIFTGRGVFNRDLVHLAKHAGKYTTLPTTSPTFFLTVEGADKEFRLGLNLSNTGQLITRLPETPELQILKRGQATIMLHKRIHYVPQANVLVTIPSGRDKLVIRNVSAESLLKKSNTDYFFVQSLPIKKAAKGERYRYQVVVKSKAGGIRYELQSSPKGMKISSSGLVTWNVPGDAEGKIPVILLVKARDGQEMFHSFMIEVSP